VAVCRGAGEARVIEALETRVGNGHAEHLLPMVERLLQKIGCRLGDLDAIAFDAGPGAFTGLRIGCGVAQGLGFALGLPLVPVVSLDAIAQSAFSTMTSRDTLGREETFVAVLADARMGEVYWAGYRRGQRVVGPCVGPAQGALEVLLMCLEPAADRVPVETAVAAGDALARYPELAQALDARGVAVHADVWPSARAIARLAADMWQRGERGVSAAEAAPVYVRDKVALDTAEQQALRAARSASVDADARAPASGHASMRSKQ
jgi:tRNA threonylcarbamoyladenosine biosynthesis protein TsaB